MKKDTKGSKASKRTEFEKLVHELWDEADDQMDNKELKQFVTDDNQPHMERLNRSGDDIGIEEVIAIGAYLVLNHLHAELHKHEVSDMEINVKAILKGEKTLREIAPESMPDDIVDALERILKATKKGKK